MIGLEMGVGIFTGLLGYALGSAARRPVRVLAIGKHGACLSSDPSTFRKPAVEEQRCFCPATSEYDPPCPTHGVRPIGQRGEYEHPRDCGCRSCSGSY